MTAASNRLLWIALAIFSTSLVLGAEKRNVLLICVDDLKPNIGAYGDALAITPNLDRLASNAVLFENAYCNQAVCSPSRNSLLTSLRPQTLGIYDLGTNFRQSRPNAVSLPQYFKNQGYHTEAMGKIFHVGHGNHEDPVSWSVPHFSAKSIGYALEENKAPTREGAMFENKNSATLPRGAAYEKADVPDDAYGDGKIADEAIKRLKAAATHPDQPFFMAVGFLKPHLPFCAPAKYWSMHDRNKFKLASVKTAPEGAPDFAPTSWGELRNYKNIPDKGPIDDETARTLIHGYYAATSYMDAQLGRVLNALNESGLGDNTIVVLWGDHGWHLGDHGMWCKHTNYEQAARIPLMVRLPGVSEGMRTKAFIETVDLYPTIAELAGLPVPQNLDGKSQAAVVKSTQTYVRKSIIHVYPRGGGLIGRAIRTDRYRMVEWKKPSEPTESAIYELYDYEADTLETRNLAKERPDVLAELKAILATHPEAKPQMPLNQAKSGGDTTKAKAQVDRTSLFNRKDTNGDNKLTRDEFLKNQPDPDKAPARFPIFDTNKDGELSREEFVYQGKKVSVKEPRTK